MKEMIAEWLEAIAEVETGDLEVFFHDWIEETKAMFSGKKQDNALSIIDSVKNVVIAERKAHRSA